MKRILLTASVLSMVYLQAAFGQQDPMFTHYMFNQVVYNPAFIGSEFGDQFCVNLVHHDQWMGYDNNVGNQDGSTAPLSTTFNIHKPFQIKNHKFGAGLVFVNDGLGFQSTQFGYLGLSYHYDLGKNAAGEQRWLIGGLNFGFIQSGIDGSQLIYIDQGDPIIGALIGDGTHMGLDFGFGLLYKTEKYYLGISNMHIPQTKVDWFGGQHATNDTRWNRHFYINAGYEYQLTENLILKPRTLIKFDRAIWQADLGILAELNGQFWGGLNVRRGEGMMILAGARVYQKKTPKGEHILKLGLSYDLTFNQIRTVSSNTMELMANYCFPIRLTPKPPKPEQDVRFLGGYTL